MRPLPLLLICAVFFSCKRQPSGEMPIRQKHIVFDAGKWQLKAGLDYPYRDSLLMSLMQDSTLRSLQKEELIRILGTPERSDGNYLFYMVRQKRMGVWPLNTKSLVIKCFPDSTVEWMKIHE